MNLSHLRLELAVAVLGLATLLLDLFMAPARRRLLGWGAVAGLAVILGYSFLEPVAEPVFAFGRMFVQDDLAMFFKRLFLLAGLFVMVMAVEFSPRLPGGVSEYFSLILFALLGMMFAASANDFAVLFVSLELVTITFYILTSFQRQRLASIEAGVKYLILGALSTGFTVFGIALVFGTAGSMSFPDIAAKAAALRSNPLAITGFVLVFAGLGFKIASFPFMIWAPDVYQGAPAPTTAFLAVGSKAAGFVLILRLFVGVVPEITQVWKPALMVLAGATILYGSLCAIPQRSLKRLMGYSGIANAGYLLLGLTALSGTGSTAMLVYLAAYLFAVLGAFLVIVLVTRDADSDDISVVAGLARRNPLLAGVLTCSMVSLAGIPPLAGFFGKFLLLKSLLQEGATRPACYWLAGVAVVGVVISLYYYFGVLRAMYWDGDRAGADAGAVAVPLPSRLALVACVAGMLGLGVLPGNLVSRADRAVAVLHKPKAAAPTAPATAAVVPVR